MSTVLTIPAHEAHVVRVFAVMEDADSPLGDAVVMVALGADGALDGAEIEIFDLADLGDMPLSEYLREGHGIAGAALDEMRGQLDGLTGRVMILPSRAFGGRATVLNPGRALRLVGRFEEEVAPVSFDPLPAGGTTGRAAPAAGPARSRRVARLAALVFFTGLAVLAAIVIWLAGAR